MVKRYSKEQFVANVNGESVVFNAWTTDTRSGFCHTISCPCLGISDTKVSYYNRTWETFQYESALSRAIDKCPKGMQKELREQLIEKKSREESERCEKMVNAFKSLHSSLSEESKERLANSNIEMQNEGDISAVMGLMGMMKVMES